MDRSSAFGPLRSPFFRAIGQYLARPLLIVDMEIADNNADTVRFTFHADELMRR